MPGKKKKEKREAETEEPRREVELLSEKEINRVSDETESIEKKHTGSKKAETAGTQPPSAARPVTQYLVTVDDLTQKIVRIEKVLDEKTGKRVELNRTEYAALYSYGITGYSTPQSAASSAYAASNPALILAYFQGVSDYLKNAGFK